MKCTQYKELIVCTESHKWKMLRNLNNTHGRSGEISDFSISVMWRHLKLLQMWKISDFFTSVMHRNLKFSPRDNFSPRIYPWSVMFVTHNVNILLKTKNVPGNFSHVIPSLNILKSKYKIKLSQTVFWWSVSGSMCITLPYTFMHSYHHNQCYHKCRSCRERCPQWRKPTKELLSLTSNPEFWVWRWTWKFLKSDFRSHSIYLLTHRPLNSAAGRIRKV